MHAWPPSEADRGRWEEGAEGSSRGALLNVDYFFWAYLGLSVEGARVGKKGLISWLVGLLVSGGSHYLLLYWAGALGFWGCWWKGA
ncbi:hypothetical protein BU26DRAFT_522029 [Trematosphaeria pertusa]|uniref:Uncharacterized protein n=1 Tax=Trematosphaeria pertusa TaxID=390896 RepID=A0A6A6I7Y1_9PLEO|nr:uncharacterized protein BU26DRAFT_522029 [Trematosphaeria pertusa]KAF2245620.1 hypothetical protein BU26DRAFT_522029 [Trematosphaeria pertusa]